jgi:hypothetical protein
MNKRRPTTGLAEELRQVAQVLRQNGLPDAAVQLALMAVCGVEVKVPPPKGGIGSVDEAFTGSGFN